MKTLVLGLIITVAAPAFARPVITLQASQSRLGSNPNKNKGVFFNQTSSATTLDVAACRYVQYPVWLRGSATDVNGLTALKINEIWPITAGVHAGVANVSASPLIEKGVDLGGPNGPRNMVPNPQKVAGEMSVIVRYVRILPNAASLLLQVTAPVDPNTPVRLRLAAWGGPPQAPQLSEMYNLLFQTADTQHPPGTAC